MAASLGGRLTRDWHASIHRDVNSLPSRESGSVQHRDHREVIGVKDVHLPSLPMAPILGETGTSTVTHKESSWLLLKQLIQLAKNVSKTAETARSHKKFCVTLTRRIKNIVPLLEELRDVPSPLPHSAQSALKSMETVFRKSKTLVEECRDGSRLYMILKSESVLLRFHELTGELCLHLEELPLHMLDISDETKEQVGLVRAQLKRARSVVDVKNTVLFSELKNAVECHQKGLGVDMGKMKEILRLLDLNTRSAIEAERKVLEKHLPSLSPGKEEEVGAVMGLLENMALCVNYDMDASPVVTASSSAPSSSSSSTAVVPVQQRKLPPVPPDDYKCPISLELMRDPVIIATGQTFERAYIQKWLDSGHRTCPKTQQVLSHIVVIPNFVLKSLIMAWCDENGVDFPDKLGAQKPGRSGRNSAENGEISGDRSLVDGLLQKLVSGTTENKRQAAEELRLLAKRSMENRGNGVDFPDKPGAQNPGRSGRNSAENGEITGDRSLVDGLLQKLVSGTTENKRQAAEELRLLAKRSMENRVCIAQAGAIPLLVHLLSSSDPKTQEHAVTALLNLSINESNKTAIMAAGAVPPIVEVLKSGSMEARENAAATLFSLSVGDENKITIGASGAIPALVDLLQEGVSRGKKDAATALFNLSIYQGNKTRAIRAGIIPPLMQLLADRTTGMVDEALAMLAILVTAPEGRSAIGHTIAVPILVDLLGTGSPRNKENAAAVLLALCQSNTEHAETAIKLGAILPLTALLQSGMPRARRKANLLLGHLQASGANHAVEQRAR
ncbi:hypothetical protein CBR_g31417 [Chara braunii]|uniref:U-box domain-containing protein 12 n=1 Tax=Chara braunii TaxID=69332 RepID=A0A388LEZ4_CHABU|nr:hypothetical protein CBR_g31417 [Chara braunii]|eukprot:GBG80861.1 hypothetical protein CBR_g31417 [Chara braunii]